MDKAEKYEGYRKKAEGYDIETATQEAFKKALRDTGLPGDCFEVKVLRKPGYGFAMATLAQVEVIYSENKHKEYLEKKQVEDQEQQERRRQELERTETIKQINDIYEYKTVSITDTDTGRLDMDVLARTLAENSKDGWRLVNTFVDEVGKNSNSAGYGGLASGTNATICETYLVFERCIKRWR